MEWSERWRRRALLALRPRTCCCVAPLRGGLLALGYFNMLVSVLLIVGTASSTFVPMCVRVQEAVVEEPSPSTCIVGPSAELALSVLLIAATYRSDLVLLRIYSWLALGALAAAVLVYCLVVALIGALYLIAIAVSLVYQSYVILLVRSFIIEIKFKDTIDKTLYYNKLLDIKKDPEAPPAAAEPQGSTVVHTDTEGEEKTLIVTSEKEKQTDTVKVTNLPPNDTKTPVSTTATVVKVHEGTGRATVANKDDKGKLRDENIGKNVSAKEAASNRAIVASNVDGSRQATATAATAGSSSKDGGAVKTTESRVTITVASIKEDQQEPETSAVGDSSKHVNATEDAGSSAAVASGEEKGKQKDKEVTDPAPTPKKRRGWFRRGARDKRDASETKEAKDDTAKD